MNTRTILLCAGDRQLSLPVNPRNLTLSRPQNTLEVQTICGETVHAACGPGLLQVTLRTFLPGTESRFYNGIPPKTALALLEDALRTGAAVRLLISDTDVDGFFLITRLSRILTEGDTDTGVEIGLKEY